MPGVSVEITFLLLLVLANGVFAMSEMAVVSARKARLQQAANAGSRKAAIALELANSPDDFLSTVQIGITLVSTLAGAFGGATLSEKLAVWLHGFPLVAPYSGALSITLVVLTISYLSLIVGELVPKRLALNNPERIATFVAGPMRRLSLITSPAVWFLTASTRLVLKLLPIRRSSEPAVTEEEVRVLIEQGTAAGTFAAAEQNLVHRIFRFADRRVTELMTPRTQVIWLDRDEPDEENRRRLCAGKHSFLPVGRGSLDRVEGVLRAKDLLPNALCGGPFQPWTALHPAVVVPEVTGALELLERLRSSAVTAALVVSEHGGVQGLVTLNDLVRAIVGDISVSHVRSQKRAQELPDGSWLMDGLLPVADVRELLREPTLDAKRAGEYETLGGLVMTHLKRIPQPGDVFETGGYRFEVREMEGNRVSKVCIHPLAPAHVVAGERTE